MPVYVIGHRNPDTDAVCSALAYADLLSRTTIPDAIAACCGVANPRTEFVLKAAGLRMPRLLLDVRPSAGEICQKDVVSATPHDTFFDIYQKMRDGGHRSIPVVGDDGSCTGLLSLVNLFEMLFQGDDDPQHTRIVYSSLRKICSVLGGTFQHVVQEDEFQEFIVNVGAMSASRFTERMHKWDPEKVLIVSGDRPTIQLPAIEYGSRALILTGGYELSPGLLQLAIEKNVSVLISPHDTATTTMLVKSARLIEAAVERDVKTLPEDMPIDAIQKSVQRRSQVLFPVVDSAGKMIGVLSRTELIDPRRTQLVLVDHNELGQAVPGADQADIIEVLDHHRLGGGLASRQPIRFINEPVGSTCTLVSMQYRQRGVEPGPAIATCLMAGIISDTLNLTSPTATDTDREMLTWAAGIAGREIDQFASDLFASGSALRVKSPDEVIHADCKNFEENGRRFSVSQIEEIGLERFWPKREELQVALDKLRHEQRLDFSCLLVTDIHSSSSLLMISGEEDVHERITLPRRGHGLYWLAGVVSRKKQFLPMVLALLSEIDAQ
jgi:manganese-dependent inorganic pyrophosphatase